MRCNSRRFSGIRALSTVLGLPKRDCARSLIDRGRSRPGDVLRKKIALTDSDLDDSGDIPEGLRTCACFATLSIWACRRRPNFWTLLAAVHRRSDLAGPRSAHERPNRRRTGKWLPGYRCRWASKTQPWARLRRRSTRLRRGGSRKGSSASAATASPRLSRPAAIPIVISSSAAATTTELLGRTRGGRRTAVGGIRSR